MIGAEGEAVAEASARAGEPAVVAEKAEAETEAVPARESSARERKEIVFLLHH